MANEKYKIMVIEDNKKHFEDVQRLINERADLVEAVYAIHLSDALQKLDSKTFFKYRPFEGILSDAHFPRFSNGPEESCAIDIIDYAMSKKMPVSIVTSTYHHGRRTEPINQRALDSGIMLIDQYIEGNTEGEAPKKRWNDGLASLIFLIDKNRAGQITYGSNPNYYLPQVGMMSAEGKPIRFFLPPYEKNALDEVRKRLRL